MRVRVILTSTQGITPPKFVDLTLLSEDYVRTSIRKFDFHGFKMLESKGGPGLPSQFTEDERQALVDLARSHPKDLVGFPYIQRRSPVCARW